MQAFVAVNEENEGKKATKKKKETEEPLQYPFFCILLLSNPVGTTEATVAWAGRRGKKKTER